MAPQQNKAQSCEYKMQLTAQELKMSIGIKCLKIILVFLILLSNTWATYTPPTASPAKDGVHPRIILINENWDVSNFNLGLTITDVKTKIAADSDYKSAVQDVIDEVDDVVFAASSNGICERDQYLATDLDCQEIVVNGAINAAFLYQLDPQNVSGLTAGYAKAQYGAKAIDLAEMNRDEINSFGTCPTTASNDWFDFHINDADDNHRGPGTLAMAIVVDWCNDHADMTQASKESFADAADKMVTCWNGYNGGKAAYGFSLFSSVQHWHVAQNGIMLALALYGDTLGAAETTKVQNVLDYYGLWWVEGFKELTNRVYGKYPLRDATALGSAGTEGNNYDATGWTGLSYILPGISTATNENWYEEVGFMKYLPYVFLYQKQQRAFYGDDPHRWLQHDASPAENAGYEYSLTRGNDLIAAVMPSLFFLGQGDDSDSNELASVMKWIIYDSGWLENHPLENSNWDTSWFKVLFRILLHPDHQSITANDPTHANNSDVFTPSMNIGNGQYYLYSALNDEDHTMVHFRAPEFAETGGHMHHDMSHFEIYKYGHLTENREQEKWGICSSGVKRDYWHNSIFVYDQDWVDANGSKDYKNSHRGVEGDVLDPDNSNWDEDGTNNVGKIIHDDLNNTYFDYVDYDYTNIFDSEKNSVNYAERELVVLWSFEGSDGNDEYVIVYDRINKTDTDDISFFIVNSMLDEPVLVDNDGDTLSMSSENIDLYSGGRWTRTDVTPTSNNTVRFDNTYDASSYPSEHHYGHGRMFMRTILPSGFEINKVGGTNHQYKDIRGRSMCTTTSANAEEAYYGGEYMVQVEADAGSNFDKLLHVFQLGSRTIDDSATILTNMDTTVPLTATTCSTGGMTGVHIKNYTKNRIVLFNDQKRAKQKYQSATIAYSATVTAASHHLLFNVDPSTYFSISGGSLSIYATSNAEGVLEFTDNDNTSGIVSYSIAEEGGDGCSSGGDGGGGGGDGGGGGCFIATAVYGSPMQPCVEVLHEFRVRLLLVNTVGKGFVRLYNTHSPPIANLIADNDNLEAIVRLSLIPFVEVSWVALKIGFVLTMSLMLLFGSGFIGFVWFRRKYQE